MRTILNQEQLKILVPGIVKNKPSPVCSERYSFVSTKEVVEDFQDLGWFPVQAKTVNARSGLEYAKHMIRFASEQIQSNFKYHPEVVYFNSMNTKSRVSLRLGIYKFICANGLITGTEYANFSARHVGSLNLQEIIKQVLNDYVTLMQTIENTYEKKILTPSQKFEFANRAIKTLFPEKAKIDPANLVQPLRDQDSSSDLFTVMNVIQERLITGNYVKNNRVGREVKSIDKNLFINTLLWNLMQEYS